MHHSLRLLILFVAIASLGCMSERTNAWHVANGWEADSFFTDDSVIALCEAIEQADTDVMKQLIADGAAAHEKRTGVALASNSGCRRFFLRLFG